MIDKCEACGTDEFMEWFQTECCGDICRDCFEGEIFYSGYRGNRAYSPKHPHEDCTECSTGINADTGKTLCRDCRKTGETHAR